MDECLALVRQIREDFHKNFYGRKLDLSSEEERGEKGVPVKIGRCTCSHDDPIGSTIRCPIHHDLYHGMR